MYQTIGNKLLNSNISSICSYSVVNFGPLTAETGWRVWGTPAHYNGVRVFNWLRYCIDVAPRKSTKLWTMFRRLLGSYAAWRNSARCKIHFASKSCVLLFWQRYCTALEQWNFRSSSFLTDGATYIPRATITLGIGPHSSSVLYAAVRSFDRQIVINVSSVHRW